MWLSVNVTAAVTTTLALASGTPMSALSDEYLHALWKASPTTASQIGWHQEGVDGRLDDLSQGARRVRLKFLKDFGRRLGQAPKGDLHSEADRALLASAVTLESLELSRIRDYSRRCDVPLDALGQTFFAMVARPYAPLPRRAIDVLSRLDAVPAYLRAARAGLTEYVQIYEEAARDDGQGLIEYLRGPLTEAFADSEAEPKIRASVTRAVAAIEDYLTFVKLELVKKPAGDYRAGAEPYRLRFGPYLQTALTPDQVLAAAERRVAELHVEMARLARLVTPPPKDAAPPMPTDRQLIRTALAQIAKEHAQPSQLLAAARESVRTVRAFIVEHKLLTLAEHDNLQIIDTPAFLRSVLGVAAFDGAPPLEPKLGAFYYITPMPSEWSPEKVENKLREYNRYMFELLTIHEAMPGHYVQFERANQVQPESRRVLRWVLGSNAYIEGWAVYAQDLIVDGGYLDGSAKLRLSQAKLELRAVMNAVLDIRLHTKQLSDEDALRLLTEEAFQERPEAEQKLRRAKLSVTQLCSYFVGGEAWRALRKRAEAEAGFDARAFHDRALAAGAVPLTHLDSLIAGATK